MTKRNKKDGKTPDREETSYTESEFIEAYRHEEARLEEIPDEELIPLRYSADEAMGRGLWLGLGVGGLLAVRGLSVLLVSLCHGGFSSVPPRPSEKRRHSALLGRLTLSIRRHYHPP